ncbi:unnamed protein product, partial [Gulo gulo]
MDFSKSDERTDTFLSFLTRFFQLRGRARARDDILDTCFSYVIIKLLQERGKK